MNVDEKIDSYEDEEITKDRSIVEKTDCVLFLDNDKNWNSIKMREREAPVKPKLGKNRLEHPSSLIGEKWGTVFEVRGPTLKKIPTLAWDVERQITLDNLDETSRTGKDNRELVDDNKSQKLTQKEIVSIRDQSEVSAEILIDKLCENSTTFNTKHELTQKKYRGKKTKKHVQRYLMLSADGWNTNELYFTKKSEKIMHMRMEALSQILTLANLCPHNDTQVLIVENCSGLVTGAVVERLGGLGRVFNGYSEKHPCISIAYDMLDLTAWAKTSIINFHLALLTDTKLTKKELNESWDSSAVCGERKVTLANVKKWICDDLCDSLIICCEYDCLSLLQYLWPYLAPGNPFVVWSQHLQPLIQVFQYLKTTNSGLAVNIRLYDNWFREYQVLPNRTRPILDMPQMGGYIVTGIKIIDLQENK
ncbi:hypothetical protein RFI_14223 [Reticulomyxa filosa]|uniref:tRNA (adenine(58)-N(1))-methyltransferase non-catalytic subunit TRM6 n=1 Tax=Reticulomyxa filosa TaxID=46433 RepID=X6NAC6_RETFI|nr:hypothetical protein RFI_14223 [Reticulomyxa filosa]|eukprot:ETO22961.1 hypothetical protein RFI_14223 [Reticulomyxa filosa]